MFSTIISNATEMWNQWKMLNLDNVAYAQGKKWMIATGMLS